MYSLRNTFDVVRLVTRLSVVERLFYWGYLVWFPSGRKSHSAHSKYYSENLASTYSGEHYVHLIGSLLNKKSISTITDIKFLGDIKNEAITIWKLVGRYGSPSRYISAETGHNKILIYKLELGGYRVKSEFHFYRNKLFYVSHSFPYIVAKEFPEIIKVILEKYQIPEIEAKNIFTSYIIDSKENVISFRNDMIFSLNYFNPASDFFVWLCQQRDSKLNDTINKSNRQKAELRDRL